jgi:glycosyltransferase involved in cell wall biosynthesis
MALFDQEAAHERRPHNVNPLLSSAHVILAVKNFAAIPGVCHIGLGVTAENTMKVLRKHGIFAEAWPAQTSKELWRKLAFAETHHRGTPISHVVVSAPSWVQPEAFKNFCLRWPETHFVQLNHSGCAYLSIDKHGIRNIREVGHLSLSLHNLSVAFNNERPQDFVTHGLESDCLYLPNLYDPDGFVTPFHTEKLNGTLRVGSFGASRPWKNQLTAAEAAVMLAHKLGTRLELYVNTKRPDGGERMIESRREIFHRMRGCELIEVPWELWPKFRKTVARMHILFSPSFDETFNVVTADGIAEGVPSVVTSAIEWTPDFWWCDPCSPESIVRVAMCLLHDPRDAVEAARKKLRAFVAAGIEHWKQFLTRPA